MTEPDQPPSPRSEDRRQPRALAPYAILWGIALLCVIFALVAMLNLG